MFGRPTSESERESRSSPRVEPKPAKGVRIVEGVAVGILAIVALLVWAVVKALG